MTERMSSVRSTSHRCRRWVSRSNPFVPLSPRDVPVSPRDAPAEADDVPSDDGSEIDVMVVYTPLAKHREGGRAAIEALIDLFVAETNQANTNSGVTHRIKLGLGKRWTTPRMGTLASTFEGSESVRMDIWTMFTSVAICTVQTSFTYWSAEAMCAV